MATRTQSRSNRQRPTAAARRAATTSRSGRPARPQRLFMGRRMPARSRRSACRRRDRLRRKLRPQGADAGHGSRRPATGTRSSPPSTTWRSPSSTRCSRPTQTPDVQAQDAADEADPRARQACAPGRDGRLSGASRSQSRRPTPTRSKASTATSRPSSTSSTRWARMRQLAREGSRIPRTGLRACAHGGRTGLPTLQASDWTRSRMTGSPAS